ncbi:hypothetical protein AXG93_3857s1000 [Marchantia polymorpha subsp. ruderalis]|uniref:Uncharacterized protein n=1 Tax=Marchantia polymorpha subsp. ruderalis TaxID=1480154 RepID=A0A176W4N8_MARPO|nr:hypothetical protein AXG93_3857s1000 [Marchantia polymorpha subsp. ruderalis]
MKEAAEGRSFPYLGNDGLVKPMSAVQADRNLVPLHNDITAAVVNLGSGPVLPWGDGTPKEMKIESASLMITRVGRRWPLIRSQTREASSSQEQKL